MKPGRSSPQAIMWPDHTTKKPATTSVTAATNAPWSARARGATIRPSIQSTARCSRRREAISAPAM